MDCLPAGSWPQLWPTTWQKLTGQLLLTTLCEKGRRYKRSTQGKDLYKVKKYIKIKKIRQFLKWKRKKAKGRPLLWMWDWGPRKHKVTARRFLEDRTYCSHYSPQYNAWHILGHHLDESFIVATKKLEPAEGEYPTQGSPRFGEFEECAIWEKSQAWSFGWDC